MVNQHIGDHGLRKRTMNMVLKINSIFKMAAEIKKILNYSQELYHF